MFNKINFFYLPHTEQSQHPSPMQRRRKAPLPPVTTVMVGASSAAAAACCRRRRNARTAQMAPLHGAEAAMADARSVLLANGLPTSLGCARATVRTHQQKGGGAVDGALLDSGTASALQSPRNNKVFDK